MDDRTTLRLLQAQCRRLGTGQGDALARLLEKSFLRSERNFHLRVNRIKPVLREIRQRRLNSTRLWRHPFFDPPRQEELSA